MLIRGKLNELAELSEGDICDSCEALKEYETVLKTAPRRFNATAGAAKAAGKAGDRTKARAYAIELREIAGNAETSRPELEWARTYLSGK